MAHGNGRANHRTGAFFPTALRPLWLACIAQLSALRVA
jgi:hypothetical protein